ncbi:eukaryotic and archaeal DNA primase, large subunit-domain-containing protein [Haematococcus lacustris]
MEFLGTRPSASAKPGQNSNAQVSRGYASNALQSKAGQHSTRHTTLSMYSELPVGDISLEDFEQLALDRLRVLKGVEEVKLRNKSDAEVQARARELVDRHLKGNDNEDTARRDQLSHFILRLAYCRTPELRKWLLLQESELFRVRFSQLLLTDSDKREFLERNGLAYCPLSPEEAAILRPQLHAVLLSQAMKAEDVATELAGSYYKVPFQAVPDLVAGRKVLLRGGYAFVSQRDVASLVLQDFRTGLSKGMSEILRRWNEMLPDSDTRLRPLVAGLATRYLGTTDYGSAASARHGPINLTTLPGIAAKHFPLCMQNLMTHLNQERHLRHGGRQQLSLFLKVVGLPLEDAMIFWRTSFAPRTPADKFDKEYAYNVRHNYGKEGNRKDYSAHNCLTLIRMTGGPQDHHGCPYRRLDEPQLRQALMRAGCDLKMSEEAVSKARAGHFQLACACAFEGAHQGAPQETGINHPAEYYNESRRVYAERDSATAATQPPAGTPAAAAQKGRPARPQDP